MTDRPITFSAPMVKALLSGAKNQTRRVLKPFGRPPEFCGGRGDLDDPTCWGWEDPEHGDWITLEKAPGQRMSWRDLRQADAPGDRLWVKEAWRACSQMDPLKPSAMSQHEPRRMEADGALIEPACMMIHPGRFRHARFMPRWASRLTLTVTDVRVQRLQEISEEDAIAEGAPIALDQWSGDGSGTFCLTEKSWRRVSPTLWFHELWNSIHGPDAWDANPWVCALTFTVERRNIDQKPSI